MPRRRYIFDPPERFVAGTVGEPGEPDVLPAGPRGRSGRVRRAREGPGRGPRRAPRRPARRAGAARRRPGCPEGGALADTIPPARTRDPRDDPGPLDEPLDRGLPGRVADARLGRRCGARAGRGPCPGRGRRGRSTPTRTTTRTRTARTCCASASDRGGRAVVRRARRAGRGVGPAAVSAVRRAARPARPHLPAAQRPLRQLGRDDDERAGSRDDPRGAARR